MAPDEFLGGAAQAGRDIELGLLAENERDEQALHRQVAEFLRDVGRVAARDGVCHFVRFLDQMARSVGELLFAIPCASLAQLGDDGEQFRERLRCRVVGHRICFTIWMMRAPVG